MEGTTEGKQVGAVVGIALDSAEGDPVGLEDGNCEGNAVGF